MRGKYFFYGLFWIAVYILLAVLPMLILLSGKPLEGREFWKEFSVALAFAGLSLLILQFALTARFKSVTAPFGSDIVYHFHRQISFVILAFIVAHPLTLFIFFPDTLSLLNVFNAPWRARAGFAATIILALLVGISLFRKKLNMEYTRWRIWHGAMAVAVIALAGVHVVLAAYYLKNPDKQTLWIAYAVLWLGALAYARLLKPLMLLRRPYEISRVIPERGNAWSLIARPVGHEGIRFMPGQFSWITVGKSPFSMTDHPFSFSSSAEQLGELSFTIKELGDFTREIKTLKPGQRVYIDGPFGSFSVDRHSRAEQFIFIAGGVGITPIMSMLRTLAQRQDKRPLTLIYCNRDWENVIFREEIDLLQNSLSLKVVHVLENAPPDWKGETGFINRAILERSLFECRRGNPFEVFICGPQPMIAVVEKELSSLGVRFGDYHSEQFYLV